MLRGQERDDLVESPPGFREPVYEQDGRPGSAGRDVVQLGVVDDGGVVLEPRALACRGG